MLKNQILDSFETKFSSYEEMHDFHKEVAQESVWRKAKISSLNAFPLVKTTDGDITNQLLCTPSADSLEAIKDTTENTKLGLRVKLLPVYEGEGLFTEKVLSEQVVYLPLRDSAVRSMLERAKISGFSLQKLDTLDLCFILNKCFELYESEALVLIRNEKISACHSDGYAILPVDELLETLVESLENKYGQVKFVEGYASHSFTTARFELPGAQNALLGSYAAKLKKLGHTKLAANLVPAVQFSTSDTGVSCARCSALLTGNGASPISIGSALEVEHKGKNSVTHFGTKVDMMFAQFGKSLEKLEKLMDIYVQYPISCMERVCKALKLPKKASLEAVAQFEFANGDAPCTAHDIYLAMQEIPFLYRTGSEGKVSEHTLFNTEESVARALSIDWEKHDIIKRVEW